MRKGGEPPQGFASFHSELRRARWHNSVCVECLKTIKSIVAGFCFIGFDTTLSDGCGI